MDKNIFFYALNFYSMIIFSSYSTPVLLFPNLASTRKISPLLIALFFSSFPMGAFPSSIIIGKLMRFYKKEKLMLILNTITSLSRFLIGCVFFINDPTLFFLVSFLARFLTGVAEGSLIPIFYSYIPDLFPENSMVKFGILEIWGSVGWIIGAPLSSLLFKNFGYFKTFTFMSSFNLIIGTIIIYVFFKTDEIVSFKENENRFQ